MLNSKNWITRHSSKQCRHGTVLVRSSLFKREKLWVEAKHYSTRVSTACLCPEILASFHLRLILHALQSSHLNPGKPKGAKPRWADRFRHSPTIFEYFCRFGRALEVPDPITRFSNRTSVIAVLVDIPSILWGNERGMRIHNSNIHSAHPPLDYG